MNTDSLKNIVLPQIEELTNQFDRLKLTEHYEDWSGINVDIASEFVTAGLNVIHRAVGSNSPLTQRIEAIVQNCNPRTIYAAVPHVGGALKVLQRDIELGYMTSVQELIHSSLFSDFLEMAEYFLSEGYKDPAAVLIGGVLEQHLRKLSTKNNIDTEYKNSNGDVRPKRAETLNADLARVDIYSSMDQKNITAWLALRNHAAHGQYNEFTKEQVDLFLQLVRNFLVRCPA